MDSFLKVNKTLVTYLLIGLFVITIFGFKFFISFLSNILLLLFLIPIFLFLIFLIGLNFYKSKIKRCDECGLISLGLSETCINCGADLGVISQNNQINQKASESTIEVNAEEIK